MFLFQLHLAVTCYMTGVIWFVQLVHYPLFTAFESGQFSGTMKQHQSLTTFVVAPMMLVELATGAWLAFVQRDSYLSWANLAMLGLIWGATFLVSVPLHAKLANGFNREIARKLVATNWIRTVMWSSRCILLLLWREIS